MSQLETCEWSNIWWEQAPNDQKPRIMIVGDSITVGYRGEVNALLGGEAYADAYSTSKSIDNPFYSEEMDLVMRQSRKQYDLIHFNCGLHGFHLSAEAYADYYEAVVRHMLDLYPTAKLVLVLSTPIAKCGQLDQLDAQKNPVVEARNEQVKRIGAKYDLAINDLYTPMLGKPQLRVDDGLHYNSNGCRYQAELVTAFIRKVLGNSAN